METRCFCGLRKEREESGPVDLRVVNRGKEEADTTSERKFYENNADAMRMMTLDEMHNKNKMQNNRQKPNHGGNKNHKAGNGKSRSYEYGKLYPGRYNTPPLREDLVPRSRMAPKEKGRGKGRGKTKLLL